MRTASREPLFEGRLSDSVRGLWLRYYPVSRHQYFRDLLNNNIHPTDHVLEIGAGSGRSQQSGFDLGGKVARYVGVDADKSVLGNPNLGEAYQCAADSLPFPDESFDVVFHYYVAEHFAEPLACHREIARVLKPGGLLLFQTPSRYWYPMLVAKVTPQWFHQFYVRHCGSGRTENDVFPTYYRFNDELAIREQLKDCGFACELEHRSVAPGYLRFSRISFLLGVAYERTIETRFPALRGVIIGVAKKSPGPAVGFSNQNYVQTVDHDGIVRSNPAETLRPPEHTNTDNLNLLLEIGEPNRPEFTGGQAFSLFAKT